MSEQQRQKQSAKARNRVFLEYRRVNPTQLGGLQSYERDRFGRETKHVP